MSNSILLHDNEKILFELKPQQRAAVYLAISNVSHYIFTILGFLILSIFFHLNLNLNGLLIHLWWVAVIVTAILSSIAYFWAKYMVSQHQYIITNQRILSYSGFWGINRKIIPYASIADVDYRQNPFQKLFDITTVFIGEKNTLANSVSAQNRSSGANTLIGLSTDEADKATQLISSFLAKNN